MIEARLVAAYEATEYLVEDSQCPAFCIRHGFLCEPLDRLLAAAGVEAWTYITACNPYSQEQLPAQTNARRMRRLERAVRKRYPVIYRGRGKGTDGWQDEPSLLVLGISETSARQLGAEFGQNAIVVGMRGAPARVVLLV